MYHGYCGVTPEEDIGPTIWFYNTLTEFCALYSNLPHGQIPVVLDWRFHCYAFWECAKVSMYLAALSIPQLLKP